MEIRKTFVMLGLPASGKGTQAEILSKMVNAEVIGVGNLIRAEIEKGDKNSKRFKQIKENYDLGIPQDDELTEELFVEKLAKTKGNIIFDNYPFSANQFSFFEKLIIKYNLSDPKVIYIKIDADEAIKRISTRYICDKCKSIYFSGKIGDKCKKCNGRLVKRSDDTAKIMRERINFAKPRIDLVVDKFSKNHNIFEIDGEKSIPEVTSQIEKII